MAANNNIKKYSAIDIQKYHKGQLSPKEMNEMEKAALDDSFLSDAMDGYATKAVNVSADIAELKKRLQQKTEEAKIIPLNTKVSIPFPWLKIAAFIVLVGSAVLLSNKFAFTKKETSLAKSEKPKIETIGPSDSLKNTAVPGQEKTDNNSAFTNPSTPKENIQSIPKQKLTDEETGIAKKAEDDMLSRKDKTNVLANAPVKITETEEGYSQKETSNSREKEMKPAMNELATANETKKINPSTISDQKKGIAANSRLENQSLGKQPVITFHGRVTDAKNAGVPFANVTNPAENTGTYTDANGYFTLTYPDSILKVQVHSIGFENSLVELKNRVATNHIVLAEDRNNLSEVVVGNKLPNTAMRSREANTTIEEPEPADGWAKYDTYLANNLNPPDDYKPKPADYPSVEVSFEIDKNGEPINIKVEKSLCNKCDKEAIRLIKEGPKWKSNAPKSGRTTVIINF